MIGNQPNPASILSHLDVRQIVLKSSKRKLYGIRPISETINKAEESIKHENYHNIHWKKCRLYIWKCLNINDIPKQYQIHNHIQILNTLITKLGTFCREYDALLNKQGITTYDKDQHLQKINEGIVSWTSKQQQIINLQEISIKEQFVTKQRYVYFRCITYLYILYMFLC